MSIIGYIVEDAGTNYVQESCPLTICQDCATEPVRKAWSSDDVETLYSDGCCELTCDLCYEKIEGQE